MSFPDAIRILNAFKRRRIIRDYVIIGAVGATAYMEPIFTEHLILLYLESFRDRDKFRIVRLLSLVEGSTLEKMLRRFDDKEGTLASRLKTLR